MAKKIREMSRRSMLNSIVGIAIATVTTSSVGNYVVRSVAIARVKTLAAFHPIRTHMHAHAFSYHSLPSAKT